MVVSLCDQYTHLCGNETSDIYEYLPLFFNAAVALPSPTIIELGVRAGCSTIAWLYAVERVGGHLWSVDGAPPCLDDDGTDLLGQYLDEERSESTLDAWTFLKGWDDEQWVLDALPHKAHIVFVDTNHTYEMTMAELEAYYPRVYSGGSMFFHDTNIIETGNATTPQPPYPVKTAIQEFCAAHNLSAHFIDDRCGLGRIFVA